MGARSINNQKGQFVVEAVLIMVLVMGLMLVLTRALRSTDAVGSLTSAPWEKLSGMIETGVWGSPDKVRAKHPNSMTRRLTSDPRRIQ